MYNGKDSLFSFVCVSHTEYIYTTCTCKNPTEARFAEVYIPYLSKAGDILVLLNGNLPDTSGPALHLGVHLVRGVSELQRMEISI